MADEISLQVKVEDMNRLDAALQRLADQVMDFRPVWPGVNRIFEAAERRQFDTQGGNSSGWAPLSPAYKQWKTINYPGELILSLTGDLRRSLTSLFNPNAVYEPRPTSLTRGTTVRYARFHKRTRPPIAVTQSDKEAMRESVRETFGAFAGKLGFEVVTF